MKLSGRKCRDFNILPSAYPASTTSGITWSYPNPWFIIGTPHPFVNQKRKTSLVRVCAFFAGGDYCQVHIKGLRVWGSGFKVSGLGISG